MDDCFDRENKGDSITRFNRYGFNIYETFLKLIKEVRSFAKEPVWVWFV